MFKLEIKTGNEAFSDHPHLEIARILKKLAERLENDGFDEMYCTLVDINGNSVGKAVWK